MASGIERIKVCLNGGRGRADHPAVPVTAAEIAADSAGAVAEGAEAVHVHPRAEDGAQSLASRHIGGAVAAIRLACAGTPVGVSTGLWISHGDVGARLASVAAWAGLPASARPDFASVNVREPGLADLVAALDAAGIGVEAGVWSVADARAVAELRRPWTRVLVEIMGGPPDAAAATADAVLGCLEELGVTGPRLLHGEGTACWPLVAHAGRLGLPTRIGLEDTTTGPAGEPVTGNADLVRHALARWTAARPAA